jgi:ABC-type glycerol-3-phosphate transport system permease component
MTRSDTKTLPVALAGLFGEFSTQYGVVMAAAVIGTLPTFLIFLFLQRYMVSSLAGAVKQ